MIIWIVVIVVIIALGIRYGSKKDDWPDADTREIDPPRGDNYH
jgi:hypothetical protein